MRWWIRWFRQLFQWSELIFSWRPREKSQNWSPNSFMKTAQTSRENRWRWICFKYILILGTLPKVLKGNDIGDISRRFWPRWTEQRHWCSFSEKHAVFDKTELCYCFISPYFINISELPSSSWAVFKIFFSPFFILIVLQLFSNTLALPCFLGFDDMWIPVYLVIKEVSQRNPESYTAKPVFLDLKWFQPYYMQHIKCQRWKK